VPAPVKISSIFLLSKPNFDKPLANPLAPYLEIKPPISPPAKSLIKPVVKSVTACSVVYSLPF